ncbi:MAG: ABC transporter substrate-binding protein [Proteobacteria bacterium]|nr:ABC transporter substrate-binding protein [Pseudomonadota bacterium]
MLTPSTPRPRILLTIAALIGLLCWAPTPSKAGNEASAAVAAFQAELLDVMRNADKLGVKGRYQRLTPVIERTFNMPLMASIAAGPYWAQGSVAERRAMSAAFLKMSAATLATLLDGYTDEVFDVVGQRAGPQGTTLVDTMLRRKGESDINISYVAHASQGRWQLIDVIVDAGISELKVRISEYRSTLKRQGLKGLVDLLNKTADKLVQ